MAAMVCTRCSVCGDLELPATQVVLRLCLNALDRSTYTFTCPTCGGQIERDADADVRNTLRPHCPLLRWRIPAEALEPHCGPALTYDDVADAHGWIESLTSEHLARDTRARPLPPSRP